MNALSQIPDLRGLRAVLLDKRGSGWGVGTGRLAVGLIDQDLQCFADREEAERAALDLADRLDILAVRR